MVATREDYKGNPTICLKLEADSKFPFSFGVRKARMILEHIEDIRRFVADNDSPKPTEEGTAF